MCLFLPLLLFFHKHRTLPPGPKGIPIIGNLHQLDISNLHLQFSKFSKIYGPLFSLQLGLRQAIVVSSAEIAKEVLRNNDHVFSNRPIYYMVHINCHIMGQKLYALNMVILGEK
jgi:hypothetical protein